MPTILTNEEVESPTWWNSLDNNVETGEDVPYELIVLMSYERAKVTAYRLPCVLEFASKLPGWGVKGSHPFEVLED